MNKNIEFTPPLTVSDLILILQKYPKHMIVAITGYENGYNDIKRICIKKLKVSSDNRDDWWNGKYIDEGDLEILTLGRDD